MIKVIDLKGKFFLIDDEYVLSVQASIIVSKDEDGYVQNEYFEFVKVLDEDGFEIDEIGLSFNPAYPDKELYATNILSLENKSQIKEIKKLQLFDKVVDVQAFSNTQINSSLVDKLEKKASTSSSQWVSHLAAKIISKSDEIVVSVKASICPQPDEDQYVQDEYFEFAKLLDEEGFQLEEIGIEFNNTKPLKITNSTARTEFFDIKLAKKIKYIQLFDHIVCINSSLKDSSDLRKEYEKPYIHEISKEPETYPKANIGNKSSCKECNSEIPFGVDICDRCRAEKLKKIHGVATQKPSDTSKKPISHCEKCRCEIPLGAKICDSCRSEQLKRIHSGERGKPQKNSIAQTSTPKSEWKPWPPKAPETTARTEKEPEKIGAIGWIIIIGIGFFLLNACFG
ncbi:zinc ribbon domain-containing protein [Acinetobacter indicus]|uniref:zinc ribbon domain-containing protein n=1 Tax=Acinetobacter indicus TaxID=756892 RepID=UPI002574C28B|nr:zinc ribbon domain-containing protein [Acinetobacter indicus]MDM1263896.1 zinc ribbon domain-containing protein [Acinetobacter indicus]